MLSSLTSYLVHSKQVFIPYIGTFELRYHPAALDFADRLIHPPKNEILFVESGNLSKEQVSYLSTNLSLAEEAIEQQLNIFGERLKSSVVQNVFTWNGFGVLKWVNDSIVFELLEANPLNPVAANKIIREGAHHDVLVGEKEMHSSDTSYMNEVVQPARWRYGNVIGWAVAALAVVFILYHLYKTNFHPSSSGLRQKPTSSAFHDSR